MGFFKDAKESMKAGQKMAEQQMGSADFQQQAANAQVINAAQPAQDGDPLLEPIDGLTFKMYVDVAYATQGMGGDNAARAAHAETMGVPSGVWASAAQKWSDRLVANPTVNKRFNAEWQLRMKGAS